MKAISLWQPWASLIAIGAKHYETRSRFTKYRGTIAIHAAKKWNAELEALVWQSPFYEALNTPEAGGSSLKEALRFSSDIIIMPCGTIVPRGCVVAIAYLSDCIEITSENQPGGVEYAFGDFTPGRFMWKIDNVHKLDEPVPCVGRQGIFNVELNKIQTGLRDRLDTD